jgi:hypothetical protein
MCSSSVGRERTDGGRRACPAKSQVLRRPSGSGEARKKKRRFRGSHGDAHLRRRTTGGAGFRRGAELGRPTAWSLGRDGAPVLGMRRGPDEEMQHEILELLVALARPEGRRRRRIRRRPVAALGFMAMADGWRRCAWLEDAGWCG